MRAARVLSGPRVLLRRVMLSVGVATLALTVAACASTDGEDTETSESELGPTTTTKLRLAGFIPCSGVSQFGIYGGDGRGFDPTAKSSRIALDVSLSSQGPDGFTAHSSPSTKYASSAARNADGWCVEVAASAQPERTATADTSRVFATIEERASTWEGYNVTHVRLEAHGKNPLVFFSPNADAEFDVYVYYARVGSRDVAKWITYVGQHDPFPSWELYVDGSPVFQHDTREEGYGPLDLIPGAELQQSGVCERKDTGWSCGR